MMGDEIVRELHNAPRPILYRLRFILNGDVVARTVAEKILHSISAIANHNKTIAYLGVAQAFDDVLEHWFPAHLDHRLREFSGKLAHPRAATRCKYHGFLNLPHEGGAQAAG